jgi:hypothetical protein
MHERGGKDLLQRCVDVLFLLTHSADKYVGMARDVKFLLP